MTRGLGTSSIIDDPSPGPAVRRLEAAGRRSAAVIRLATLVPVVAVALIAGLDPASGVDPEVLLSAVVLLVGWSAVYVLRVVRRRDAVLALVDAGVLGALGWGAVWLVPLSWRVDGASWIVPLLAFAGVGYQYSCSRAVGLGVLASLTTVSTAGAVIALPPGATNSTIVSTIWAGATGLLATALWALVRRGGRRADALRAEREEAERRRDVAEAVSRDRRDVASALHDTAAATLLVVGLGDLADRERVAARARRDLEVLDGFERTPDEGDDLVARLHHLATTAPLSVVLSLGEAPCPPAAVSRALALAAAEAVANVERHSGATEVEVTLEGRGEGVRLTVVDRGRGFERAAVPPTRRGLRESIEGRTAAVGGTAHVDSRPGDGTRVVLDWAP